MCLHASGQFIVRSKDKQHVEFHIEVSELRIYCKLLIVVKM